MFNYRFVTLSLVGVTAISGLILSSSSISASDTVIDNVNVKVPVACTLSGVGMDSHTASIAPGNYNSAIGETTVKAVCNDFEGFGIYAIGYTDSQDGKNVLTNSALSSSSDIITGTALSGNSQWAMKLTAITSPTPTYPITIQNSFDSFHTVPDDYTLVAKRTTQTDFGENAEGASFKTTYQAYISSTQPTGTYNGKVKYILVHPHTTPTPRDTMLDTGPTVCAKMKTLAAGANTACNTKTSDIKAIRMADSLPSGFIASEANTVSTADSTHPIYIFFDNTNDAGIMYFYSGGYQVIMNPDSSYTFRSNLALGDISGVEYWDTSNVTSIYAMFVDSTISLSNLNGLQRWDTSNISNMQYVFSTNKTTAQGGATPQLSDISALINWDTSSVTDMRNMFQNALSLSSLHGLEFWDTSNVVSMYGLFTVSDGMTPHLSDISALANWNTSSLENMDYMFQNALSLTSLQGLENWDTSSVTNMQFTFGLSAEESKISDAIIDLSPLKNWDVSNVTTMNCMFQNNNISSFVPLRNWDVGEVKDFRGTFNQSDKSTTTTLAGLENWDVSSATNMYNMFRESVSLIDASAINNWDVRNVSDFTYMFQYAPVHPTFTLRAGTWNSSGTFIPSS